MHIWQRAFKSLINGTRFWSHVYVSAILTLHTDSKSALATAHLYQHSCMCVLACALLFQLLCTSFINWPFHVKAVASERSHQTACLSFWLQCLFLSALLLVRSLHFHAPAWFFQGTLVSAFLSAVLCEGASASTSREILFYIYTDLSPWSNKSCLMSVCTSGSKFNIKPIIKQTYVLNHWVAFDVFMHCTTLLDALNFQ